MKSITIMSIATFAPFVAAAETGTATVSTAELQETVPLTQLSDADVLGIGGENYGDVHGVLLDSNGRVTSLLVKREGEQGSTADAGQTSGSELATVDVDVADAAGTSGVVEVPWENISYDQQENKVRLSGETRQTTVVAGEPGNITQRGVMLASDLLDMNVALSDAESYGEVQDILINPQEGQATAVVVDTGGFFASETYAVPFDAATINEQQREVVLPNAEQDFEEAEELDIDSITDST